MGEDDVELVEALIVVYVQEGTVLNKKSLSYIGEPLTGKELLQKIEVDGRSISIRQHICETIIPYYKRR